MASYKLPFTGPEVKDRLNKVTDLEKNKANRSEIPSVPVQSVNGKTGDVKLSADDVEARPNTWIPSAADVRADTAGTASSAVTEHNTATDAHNDIRLWLSNVETWVKNLLDADDETLNQTSEMIQYMKDNRELIEQITTGKVSVTDIINNLTTNVSDKPLSAAQGVVLKGLIDALQTAVNAAAKATDLTSHTGNTTVHIKAAERTKWNQAVTDVGNLSEEIDNYLPKFVGTDKIGKIPVVGTNGYLVFIDMPEGGASGDVIGTFDENNNILLSGDIAVGTYTLAYVDEEGNLTGTGSLVVSEIEPEPEPEEVVNLIPTLTDIDLTTIYNNVGYKQNVRVSVSSVSASNPTGEKTQTGTTLLGIMPLGNDGDALHLRGAKFRDGSSSEYSGGIWYYDSSGKLLNSGTISIEAMGGLLGTDANGDATFTLTHSKMSLISGTAYIRLNIGNPTGELFMTRNQLIPVE